MDRPGFLYLLTADNAALLKRVGLVAAADGALGLAQLPAGTNALLPQALAGALAGPAGIGVDESGNLYIADPDHDRILRRDACSGENLPLACFGGSGSLPGQLQAPRGVLVGPRQALYVADSGNHRIQVVDLFTQQIRAVWGQPDPFGAPQPGSEPGQFNDPWDLAADEQGFIYVVDHGNHRIQKFTAGGAVLAEFWQALSSQTGVSLLEPAAIAIAVLNGAERLLVIDRGDGSLRLFATDGSYDPEASQTWAGLAATNPSGLSFTGERLYVGDAACGAIYVYDLNGALLGTLPGQGSIYGLAMDRQGRLLVHSGPGGTINTLLPGQVYATQGTFLYGPIDVGAGEIRWQRLEADLPALPESCHLRLFSLTSPSPAAPPPLPAAVPLQPEVAETPWNTWRAAPRDAAELAILNQPGRYLWIAGLLVSDGSATPWLRQLRVEYDRESWLRYLPAIYTPSDAQPDPALLIRWALGLFQGVMESEERLIERMPELFDAQAAPSSGAPNAWLDWLAGWLALNLPENWSETQKRQTLQKIFRLYARRGTVGGLRDTIELYTGAKARIIEPAQTAALWTLGEGAGLGFDSMLMPAEPQGAVAGTTAELDFSHLTQAEEYGAPLFADLAHQFCVQVYAHQLATPAALELLKQVVEQEKPAHTQANIQVIEARLRVGRQATLGVDAIVAAARPQMNLGEAVQLGVDSGLADDPRAASKDPRLGLNSKLL